MTPSLPHLRRSTCAGTGLLTLMAGAALTLGACASTPPPTAQVAVSEAAVAHAVSAGAPALAPVEMQLARDKMHRASVAMIAKDYDQARVLAREAEVDAQAAEAKALSSKARQAADELREDRRVLREELDRKAK